ncbi:hypothetical protein SEEE5518_12196 [Salmonella enterica subsp. enterica serovar Enteritidis str. 648905 5-18]|nr:hypothetical protein SEEE5518_12196 [Salmonella enterica subsp. enterica serovar Enteritidis str. 648905 5-18]
MGLGLVHGMAHPLGAFLQHAAWRRECYFASACDAF